MNSLFVYSIGIAFMGGVFLRSFFVVGISEYLLGIFIGSALVCAGMIMRARESSVLILLGVVFISGACGVWRMSSARDVVSTFTPYENQDVAFDARVVREPDVRDTNVQLVVEPIGVSGSRERIQVMVNRFANGVATIAYGDELHVRGVVKKPEVFTTQGEHLFDYPGYLRVRGIQYTILNAHVEKYTEGAESLPRILFAAKHKFQAALEKAIGEPMAGLGEGILLGVPNALGTQLENAFRITGIIHIVVLSGYNIMIVVEWLTYILSFLLRPRMRMIVGIVAIGAFVFLVGASATAVRAGIMASLLLGARGTGRTYGVLRALMVTAVGMVMLNPFLLVYDPGFQLSFLATLGLILFSPLIERKLGVVPERFGIRLILTATLATQVCVFPLLLYHTGMFSTLAIITNILVLPVVPLAMILTFSTGCLGLLIPALATFVGFPTSLSLLYIIKVAEIGAALPFASFSVAVFPFWITCVLYAVIGGVFVAYAKNEKRELEYIDLSSWIIEDDTETTTRADARVVVSPHQ